MKCKFCKKQTRYKYCSHQCRQNQTQLNYLIRKKKQLKQGGFEMKAITVGELKKLLQSCPDERCIILEGCDCSAEMAGLCFEDGGVVVFYRVDSLQYPKRDKKKQK